MHNTCHLNICETENNNQISPEPSSSKPHQKLSNFRKCQFVFSIINRLLIGFVTFYMSWMCLRVGDWKEIPWHALFCTLGFICFMSEGVFAHYYGNSSTQNCNRNDKTNTHWILQLFATLLGISGICAKIILEEKHFYTFHGKIGLATLILLLGSLLTGISSINAHKMRYKVQPMLNKATHTILGLLTYSMSIIGIFSAFETDIFLEYSLDGSQYMDFCLVLKISIIIIYALTSYGPIWCLIYSKLWKCC